MSSNVLIPPASSKIAYGRPITQIASPEFLSTSGICLSSLFYRDFVNFKNPKSFLFEIDSALFWLFSSSRHMSASRAVSDLTFCHYRFLQNSHQQSLQPELSLFTEIDSEWIKPNLFCSPYQEHVVKQELSSKAQYDAFHWDECFATGNSCPFLWIKYMHPCKKFNLSCFIS